MGSHLKIEYLCTGNPGKRPFELNWYASIGDVREKRPFQRSFHYQRVREGPDADNSQCSIATHLGCSTRWKPKDNQRAFFTLGAEDKLGSLHLDKIHIHLQYASRKTHNFVNQKVGFYYGPGYVEYCRPHSSSTPQTPGSTAPIPSRDEFGRYLEGQNEVAEYANVHKGAEGIWAYNTFFVQEANPAIAELFTQFDKFYTEFRKLFKTGEMPTCSEKFINQTIWPRFKSIMDFSIESRLVSWDF
jgi:hypothetical protein